MNGPLLKDIFVPLKGPLGIIGGDPCISGGHDLYGRRRAKLSREEKVLLAADSYKQEVARTSAQPLIKNSRYYRAFQKSGPEPSSSGAA